MLQVLYYSYIVHDWLYKINCWLLGMFMKV